MAKAVNRSPMKEQDVQCIRALSVLIEQEVEAKDLVPHLYSVNIIDYNDKDEIMRPGTTRLERIRNLLDTLHHRGPDAFLQFTKALNSKGYGNLAAKLYMEQARDRQDGLLPDCETPNERLLLVENAWELLSRRLTKIEGKLEPFQLESPEDEIAMIKLELEEVKTVTFARMQELTEQNSAKDLEIQLLKDQLKGKDRKLIEAQLKIKQLEKRTLDLERKLLHAKKDIDKQTKVNKEQQTELTSLKCENTQMSYRTATLELSTALQGEAIQKLQEQFEAFAGKKNTSARKASAKTNKVTEFPTLRYNCKYTKK